MVGSFNMSLPCFLGKLWERLVQRTMKTSQVQYKCLDMTAKSQVEGQIEHRTNYYILRESTKPVSASQLPFIYRSEDSTTMRYRRKRTTYNHFSIYPPLGAKTLIAEETSRAEIPPHFSSCGERMRQVRFYFF